MNKYKAIKINGKKHDEHRWIMEQVLGRKLRFNEVVHHKDGDKSNNNLDNLEILSRSEHSAMHMTGRVVSDVTRNKLKAMGIVNRNAAVINVDTARKIKNMISQGIRSCEIQRSLGVSKYTIRDIKSGKCWYWV